MKRLLWTTLTLAFAVAIGCQYLEKKKAETEDLFSKTPQNITSTVPWAGQAIAADTFIKISKRADPAVVNIGTTKIIKGRGPHQFFFGGPEGQGPNGGSPFDDFFGDDLFRRFFGGPGQQEQRQPDMKQQSLGSGFVVNTDGFILTNNHVVEKADEITVTIGRDHEYKAKVIGTDPKTDLALIKVEPKEKLETLALGDSDKLEVGEIVVAIGNPFGLSHTVTQGIVSAKERTIGAGPYDNFIQTDASINPGNSGGPLLNLRAEVVGINTAIVASGQGIGFAIPINVAKLVADQLKTKGKVTRGWLGVLIQKVDPDLAKSLNLKDKRGALVSSVQEGSPAAKAGMKQGDVIVKFGDKEIIDFNELPRTVAMTNVGDKVRVEWIRDGKHMSAEVIIGELKATAESEETSSEEGEEEGAPSREDQLGLVVQNLTTQMAQKLKLPVGSTGVVVENVAQDKPAFEKGIRPGDVIVEVNRRKISGVSDYQKSLKSLQKGSSVLLLVRRGTEGTLFIAFTL